MATQANLAAAQEIPTYFRSFKAEFEFTTEADKSQIIAFVSDQVAKIYARLFTYDGQKHRNNTVLYTNSLPAKYPTVTEVYAFASNLKDRITQELQNSSSVSLPVDYDPQGLLDEVCIASGLTIDRFDPICYFFPVKSVTNIYLQKNRVQIEMKGRKNTPW